MSKKNKPDSRGYVYSTNPDFAFEQEDHYSEGRSPAEQKLKIRLDTKHRGGKAVTLIEGFKGSEKELEELGRKLKNFCGAGGSVKEGEIIVQGDHREKLMQWLNKNGYTQSRKV